MKKLINLKFSVVLISVAIISFGCEKGDKGDMGNSGKDGNANVHTSIHTVLETDWYHIGSQGSVGDGYEIIISEALITPAIVSSGLVLVYRSEDTLHWTALPTTLPLFYSGVQPFIQTIIFQYSENQVLIDVFDDTFFTIPPSTKYYFKIAVITGSQIISNPKVNWSDYSEVRQILNLKD